MAARIALPLQNLHGICCGNPADERKLKCRTRISRHIQRRVREFGHDVHARNFTSLAEHLLWHCAYWHNSANLSALPTFAVWCLRLHTVTQKYRTLAAKCDWSDTIIRNHQPNYSFIWLFYKTQFVFNRALIWLVIWLGMSDDRNFHYSVIIYRCEIWWCHRVKTTPAIRLLTSCRCLLSRLTRSPRHYWNWRTTVASEEDKYSKYPAAPAAHSQSRRITVGTGFNSIHPRLFGSLRRLWEAISQSVIAIWPSRCKQSKCTGSDNLLGSQTASQTLKVPHPFQIFGRLDITLIQKFETAAFHSNSMFVAPR